MPYWKVPCSVCVLKDKSAHTVEYDDSRVYDAGEICHAGDYQTEETESEPKMPVTVMTAVVALLLSMSPKTFAVLGMRHAGMPYQVIARRQHSTVAATEALLRRAMSKHPELKSLLVLKAKKQERRRRGGSGGKG